MEASHVIEFFGQLVDIFGVAVIIVGTVLATLHFARRVLRREEGYKLYRKDLGKTLLLGLELLVAADIIRTVAVTPTLESVLVLAVIVLIRTFLSWSLEVEINGHLPWQRKKEDSDSV